MKVDVRWFFWADLLPLWQVAANDHRQLISSVHVKPTATSVKSWCVMTELIIENRYKCSLVWGGVAQTTVKQDLNLRRDGLDGILKRKNVIKIQEIYQKLTKGLEEGKSLVRKYAFRCLHPHQNMATCIVHWTNVPKGTRFKISKNLLKHK